MAGLSLSLRQPLQLAELSHNARLGFVTTNLAYWIVAILVLTGGELPAVPVADCLGVRGDGVVLSRHGSLHVEMSATLASM
ncbi:MAG: hypothetical protein SGPRY_009440 [Prymnesium sp.]